jgi:hypothetical protein
MARRGLPLSQTRTVTRRESLSCDPLASQGTPCKCFLIPPEFLLYGFLVILCERRLLIHACDRNPHERHNEEIINHLYEIGFQTGVSDLILQRRHSSLTRFGKAIRRHGYGKSLSTALWPVNVLIVVSSVVQHVHNNVYRLHAILLARSPYLAHLLQTSPHTGGDRVIYVPVEHEPEITPEVRSSYMRSDCGAETQRRATL